MGALISIIVSIFLPDLEVSMDNHRKDNHRIESEPAFLTLVDIQDDICAALLNAIPENDNISCGECGFSIGGIISIDATAAAACALQITDAYSCEDVMITGEGGIGAAFGGEFSLMVDGSCDIPDFGTIDADISGAFSEEDGVGISSCSISVDLDEDFSSSCSCEGCGDSGTEVEVACTVEGQQVLAPVCINFLDTPNTIEDAISGAL